MPRLYQMYENFTLWSLEHAADIWLWHQSQRCKTKT